MEGECKFHANILTQDCSEQLGWLNKALAAVPKDDWLIVVAHHPADEIDVEDFLYAAAARGFDLYLNGHVHTLNQYTIDGGGSYVTSGAGAMVATQDQTTPAAEAKLRGGAWRAGAAADGHTYETVWNQKVAGFTLHTFSDDYQSLETQYIDYTGAVVHSFTTKKGGAPSPGPGPSPSPTPSSCGGAHAYPCTVRLYLRPQGERAAVRRRRVRLLRLQLAAERLPRLRRRGRGERVRSMYAVSHHVFLLDSAR